MSIRIESRHGRDSSGQPTPVSPVHSRFILQGGLIGIAIALAGSLIIYAIGNLGAPIMVVTGWSPDGAELSVAEVIGTIVVSVATGAGLLALIQHRTAKAWPTWTVVAALTTLTSAVPLFRLDIDAGSKLALVSMHLTTGAAAIAGQSIARVPRHRSHRQHAEGAAPTPIDATHRTPSAGVAATMPMANAPERADRQAHLE